VDLLKLNDSEFHTEFENAAQAHQTSTINILHFINECERRKSYLDRGYSSIFSYCVRKLKYSSSTAGRMIQAARCIAANPEVLQMLQAREVSVTSISQVAGILDDANRTSILGRMRGASWRDVERIAREYRPPVELRDRMVPVRVATTDGVLNMMFMQQLVSDEFSEIFHQVRNLRPNESYGETCEAVFREYRDRHSPAVRHPRRETKKGSASLHSHRWECGAAERTRYIPDEVRDVVFMRDGAQCTFIAPDGTRCQCTRGLQVDHIKPFANGGELELSNLRLLCGPHNRRSAELTMGRHVMKPYWRRS